MTLSHRELGALRGRLTFDAKSVPAAEMREIGRSVGVDVKLTERKLVLAERILDKIGRPFDRAAAAALRRQPVMLVEHDERGLNRHLRRHAYQTRTISRFEKVQVRRTIPKRYRRPATMEPATARQIREARAALARSAA